MIRSPTLPANLWPDPSQFMQVLYLNINNNNSFPNILNNSSILSIRVSLTFSRFSMFNSKSNNSNIPSISNIILNNSR